MQLQLKLLLLEELQVTFINVLCYIAIMYVCDRDNGSNQFIDDFTTGQYHCHLDQLAVDHENILTVICMYNDDTGNNTLHV